MRQFDTEDIKKIYIPASDSHKGQNGKLLIIGGSKLFHAASLWSLKIASRIVDMVFYSSVPENNDIVSRAKEEFRDGIVVPRNKIENYIQEADCVLIGPGLPRKEGEEKGDDDTKTLTESLLLSHKNKKWVIDGGSLQTIDKDLIPESSILTPHPKEFEVLFGINPTGENIFEMAKKYNCVILVKGEKDIVASSYDCVEISGGNAGMTKGGTGDVLAGLVAALYCKNDAFLCAKVGSYINKKAGESLAQRVGLYFNASDLVDEIPQIMSETIKPLGS